VVRQSRGDLLLTGGDLYLYSKGVWRLAGSSEEQWLKVLIQQGADALGAGTKLSAINAAWKRLTEHPPLYRANVEWDPGSLVAVANGTLDLRTRSLSEWKTEHFLRRKLDVAYDPSRAAPGLIAFLDSLFTDRDQRTRAHIIGLLQEFCGASLAIRLLKREQRRALILIGPSRTGKTELARLISRLVGNPIASPSVAQLAERFGPSSLYGAAAWIRDDAINEGDKLDPQRFKTIVTGEAIELDRKQRDYVRVELDIPVVLTANSLPVSRDASDAVFNRCLVVDMTNVITEEAAQVARQKTGLPNDVRWFTDWLFDQENSGILNWALDGLTSLLRRGRFDIPEPVAASIQGFKDSTTPVAEWARTMLVRSEANKIERGDLLCAFQGWWRHETGDDVRLLGARWLFPKLRTACPWMLEIRTEGVRCFGGIALTEEGLKFWKAQNDDAQRGGRGAKGTAASANFVNQFWNGKHGTDFDSSEPDRAPQF
jgi:P4 family phage/plasmid primase-like protien